MAVVKFNEVDAFLAELNADSNKVERSIIRIVFRVSQDGGMPLRTLTLIASAIVAGHVVRLERRLGSFMMSDEEKKLADLGDKIADQIREAAGRLQLEVRSGTYEAA